MIIAIAGLIGVGKSTVARLLAARLGFRYISAGEGFREMARQRGLTVLELNRLAEEDPEVDRQVDRTQADLASAGRCVVESRLSGWVVKADLKVWLRAPFSVRAGRVARRDGIALEVAERDLRSREESERRRYHSLYGIDIEDLSPYHLVIDTSLWAPEILVDIIGTLIERTARVPDEAHRG